MQRECAEERAVIEAELHFQMMRGVDVEDLLDEGGVGHVQRGDFAEADGDAEDRIDLRVVRLRIAAIRRMFGNAFGAEVVPHAADKLEAADERVALVEREEGEQQRLDRQAFSRTIWPRGVTYLSANSTLSSTIDLRARGDGSGSMTDFESISFGDRRRAQTKPAASSSAAPSAMIAMTCSEVNFMRCGWRGGVGWCVESRAPPFSCRRASAPGEVANAAVERNACSRTRTSALPNRALLRLCCTTRNARNSVRCYAVRRLRKRR